MVLDDDAAVILLTELGDLVERVSGETLDLISVSIATSVDADRVAAEEGGEPIRLLLFADDAILLNESSDDAQKALDAVEKFYLLIFYLPDPEEWRTSCARMEEAGFTLDALHAAASTIGKRVMAMPT